MTDLELLTLEQAFDQLPGYEWGPNRQALDVIDAAVITALGNTEACRDLEARLVTVLQSDATRAAKQFVCRELAVIGSSASVPVLATLLDDNELAHMARYALEAVGGAAAADALRAALPRASGERKLGIIHSLGRLQDPQAAAALAALLSDPDPNVAGAAVMALGKIDTAEAAQAVRDFQPQAPEPLRPLAVEALLGVARRLQKTGKNEEAAAIYETFRADTSAHVRMAAFQGLVASQPARAVERLIEALAGDDDPMRGLAAQLIRDIPEDREEDGEDEAVAALAGSLRQLPPAGQEALLGALTGRKQAAVRAAALEALEADDENVPIAALRVLAFAGRAEDVPTLARLATVGGMRAGRRLAKADLLRDAAFQSLIALEPEAVDAAILAHLDEAAPNVRATLIRSLAVRKPATAVPALLRAAEDEEGAVRLEAYKALRVLADETAADALVALLARSQPGDEREAAERAVLASCEKTVDPEQRADPLLAALDHAETDARCALLPALGRIGGRKALGVVRAAMSDPDEAVRDAGVRALANWPDASVANELLDVARNGAKESHRVWALRGFARVVPLPSDRPPQEAFEMLKTAMELAARTEDKQLILSRLEPVRVPDALAFALSYVDDEALKAEAIRTSTRLAEGMKESHPKEARAGLERVLEVTDDERLREHIEKLLWNMKQKGH